MLLFISLSYSFMDMDLQLEDGETVAALIFVSREEHK